LAVRATSFVLLRDAYQFLKAGSDARAHMEREWVTA
jgi:hypothetical protein